MLQRRRAALPCLALCWALVSACGQPARSAAADAPQITLDSFESPDEIAAWSPAAAASCTLRAVPGATDGSAALGLAVDLRGEDDVVSIARGAQASLLGFGAVAADVALPDDAPRGLRARLVLRLGPSARPLAAEVATALEPGRTARVALPLDAGDLTLEERADVRGYGLVLEGHGIAWQGEVRVLRVLLTSSAQQPLALAAAR